MSNIDAKTVASFGDEWSRFDQSGMSDAEARKAFDEYFAVFPWDVLPPTAEGFDMGCGSGRWARFVAPRVGRLNCVDPSAALKVAQTALAGHTNVTFHLASVDASGLQPAARILATRWACCTMCRTLRLPYGHAQHCLSLVRHCCCICTTRLITAPRGFAPYGGSQTGGGA